jgi:hypothetical protein
MTDNARRTGPAVEAHCRLIAWLIETVERFPRSQRFLLGDRIQTVALDVLNALIEATYTRDRRGHLARANLGLEKLRFLMRLAFDRRHLDARRYEHGARSIDEVGRLVGSPTPATPTHSACGKPSSRHAIRAVAGGRVMRLP